MTRDHKSDHNPRGMHPLGASLYRMVARRWFWMAGAVALSTLAAAAGAGVAYLSGPALGRLFGEDVARAVPGLAMLLDILPGPSFAAMALTLALVGLARSLAMVGETAMVALVRQGLQADLRALLFQRLLSLPPDQVACRPSGEVVANLTQDVIYVESMATDVVLALTRDVIQAAVLAALALTLEPRMGLVVAGLLPVVVGLLFLHGRVLRAVERRSFDGWATMMEAVEETVQASLVIRIFFAARERARRFGELSRSLARAMTRAEILQTLPTALLDLVAALVLVGVILAAAPMAGSPSLSPSRLISFVATMAMLFRPLRGLIRVNGVLQGGLAALSRLRCLWDLPPDPRPIEGPAPSEVQGELAVRGVHVRRGSTEVLRGVDLTLRPGDCLALVGATGAGKTTLVHCLLGLIRPHQGQILVDGVDLEEIPEEGLRALISAAPQRGGLLRASLRDNVTLGISGPMDPAQLDHLAAQVGLSELIAGLPRGWGAVSGEDVGLSGGEEQRVALLRALVRQPPVLILDEALASLDSKGEEALMRAIVTRRKRAITVLVSHRLSTVRLAPQAAVLKGGRIVQRGAVVNLEAQEGPFRELFRGQMGEALTFKEGSVEAPQT